MHGMHEGGTSTYINAGGGGSWGEAGFYSYTGAWASEEEASRMASRVADRWNSGTELHGMGHV